MMNDNCIGMTDIRTSHQCTKQYCTGHFTYISFLRYVVFVDDSESTVLCRCTYSITFTLTQK